MYKFVVFDVDGTLVNSEKATWLSLNKLLHDHDMNDVSRDVFEKVFTMTSYNALNYLGVKEVEKALLKWGDYLSLFKDEMALFGGIKKVLSYLKDKGVSMGIVTSRKTLEMEIDPAMTEIKGVFDAVVCADHTEKHKPHPDPLLKILEKTGRKKDETLYIGDSLYDQQSAAAGEIDFGAALWGSKHDFDGFCSYYFNSPEEILKILKF